MASDLYLTITRKEPDSEIVRAYPYAAVAIYAAGTTTPTIWSGAADQHGIAEIPSLATGQYDLWVAGSFQRSFHHVTTGYIGKFTRSWTAFIPGTLSTCNETDQTEVFYTAVAGKLLEIRAVVQEIGASSSGTIHILAGTTPRAAALTRSSNSLWSVICNPGGATFGWSHQDTATQPAVAANSNITIACVASGTLKGLTVDMLFKAD